MSTWNPVAWVRRRYHHIRSMAYPFTPQLYPPVPDYSCDSYRFRQRCVYDGIEWGEHLGEDSNLRAGTAVHAIGRGRVVYARLHRGNKPPEGRQNWGHVVIVAHRDPYTKAPFFSIYGHLDRLRVQVGQTVDHTTTLGYVGRAFTPENGMWESHLHLGIYTGPWEGRVLPGYHNPPRTVVNLAHFQPPLVFIQHYNQVHAVKTEKVAKGKARTAQPRHDRGRPSGPRGHRVR